jgi:hypothetical protein
MSDIATMNQRDPFAAYAAAAAPPQGQFLKFSKGEWLFGKDLLELALGSRFAANMQGFRLGWRRWENQAVTDERMELLIDCLPVPSRSSLGDNDKALWEPDADGKPRDPWAFTNELQLMSPDGDLYIYSTTSESGKRDLGQLCGAYTEGLKQHPRQVPVVTLGRSSYVHKQYGKLYTPELKIVDWTDESVLAIAAPPTEAGEDDDIPFEDDRAPSTKAKLAAATYQQHKDTLAANVSAGAKKAEPVRRGAKF